MLRLKQLKVKNCRGIRDGPDLNFEAGGLLLCGDSGTGKSSYIDAIEKILTGKCSSLESGVQGISWNKHGTHIKCKNDPEIELTITDGNKDYRVDYEKEPQDFPKNLNVFLDSAKVHPFILRRKTLLDFIAAKPQERYEAIEDFLKLDQFKEFEVKLKELQNDCQEKCTDAESRKDENIRALRSRLNLPPQSPVDVKTCTKQANQLLIQVGISPLKTLANIPDRLKKIEEGMAPLNRDESLQKWTNLLTTLQDIQKNDVVTEAGRDYSESRQELLTKQDLIKGHFYAEILEKGLAWIREDRLERCPLCNNTINADEVSRYVQQKIQENNEIIFLTKDQNQRWKSFLSILTKNLDVLKKIKTQSLEGLEPELLEKLDLLIATYNNFTQKHQELTDPAIIISDITELNQLKADGLLQEFNEKITTICSRFSDNERYLHLFNTKTALDALALHMKNIERCDVETQHFKSSNGQMQILVKYAEQARKTAVQSLMDTITDIADTYFQKIHPAETIGKPQLTITDRGTGSVILTSTFYGKVEDPRGHYSEGHIDTLGLCLFLAICRAHQQQVPEFSLLILDDVLHSVDGNHRRRTAELIFQEFGDHQIIITTHDRMWFEILKMVSRSNGGNKKFKEYQIADWTLEEGPIFGDHLSEYDWLISAEGLKAQPADRVIKSGRLLEETLQNLCDSLTISVPFKIRGDYTIDPLWSSFYQKAKKQKEFYETGKKCLDSIDILRQQRNWVGAHYNEWAKTLTGEESKEFAKSVIDLRNFVYCENCNQFIARISQLDGVWSCKGEHLKYR
jgi:DNA repair exonuclease SbcCD ATPase subunit